MLGNEQVNDAARVSFRVNNLTVTLVSPSLSDPAKKVFVSKPLASVLTFAAGTIVTTAELLFVANEER